MRAMWPQAALRGRLAVPASLGEIVSGLSTLKEMRVSRHLGLAIILTAVLAPVTARAQVNIDQDKTPAHIFSSDCSVCHKTTRGLANGRGSSALTGFLAEHYTSSREEAAAVAAYVLSAGGGVGTAAPVRGQKPDSARGRASAQEPKTDGKTAAKPDARPEPKTRRAGKPEEEPSSGAKPRRAARERGKPKEERSASVEPATPATEKKPADRRGSAGAAAAKPKAGGEAAPPEPTPAAVTAAAKPAEPAKPEAATVSPAATVPAQPLPAAAPTGPTDEIPD